MLDLFIIIFSLSSKLIDREEIKPILGIIRQKWALQGEEIVLKHKDLSLDMELPFAGLNVECAEYKNQALSTLLSYCMHFFP